MTLKEFIERTNIVPTQEEYTEIKEMYSLTRNMNKDTFCHTWQQCGRNPLTQALFTEAKFLSSMILEDKEKLTSTLDKTNNLADILIRKSASYSDMDLYYEAVELFGQKTVTFRKLSMSLPLFEDDIEYIRQQLTD